MQSAFDGDTLRNLKGVFIPELSDYRICEALLVIIKMVAWRTSTGASVETFREKVKGLEIDHLGYMFAPSSMSCVSDNDFFQRADHLFYNAPFISQIEHWSNNEAIDAVFIIIDHLASGSSSERSQYMPDDPRLYVRSRGHIPIVPSYAVFLRVITNMTPEKFAASAYEDKQPLPLPGDVRAELWQPSFGKSTLREAFNCAYGRGGVGQSSGNKEQDKRLQSLADQAFKEAGAKMKESGYPYMTDWDEYKRYITTNIEAMTFWQLPDFTFSLELLKSLFIPSPIRKKWLVNHAHIVGRSGSGKSEFLRTALRVLDSRTVLLDPHGDIAEEVGKREGTLFIAPAKRRFVVNPFDIKDKTLSNVNRASGEIMDMIGELLSGTDMTSRMKTVLYPVIHTLLRLPYADFAMLADCINPRTGKECLKQLAPHVAEHLRSSWELLLSDDYDDTKKSITTRLRSFLDKYEIQQTICGADEFGSLIEQLDQENGNISISLGRLDSESAQVIGRFFMVTMQIWAKRREELPEHMRKPVVFVVDECQNFLTLSTAKTLDQYGRKYGLFLHLAHQYIAQIPDREIRDSIKANTKAKICGRTDSASRQAMANEMRLDADDFATLEKGHFWGEFEGNKEPIKFYSRLLPKLKENKGTLCGNHGAEMVNGWEGFDREKNTYQTDKPTPRKGGYKAKFDL